MTFIRPLLKHTIFFISVFFLLSLPWLLQWSNCPPGSMPTGFFCGGVDYHTYIAKIKWFMEGNMGYVNLFTGEKTEPVRIYHIYQFFGKIAGITGLSIQWTFHLARALLGSVAVLLIFRFMKKYSGGPASVATLFTVFAAGGYLVMSDSLFGTHFNADSADYFLQGRVWLALLTFPHYCISLIGLLLLLEAHSGGYAALALAGGFLMSLAHPFLAALFVPVILIDGCLKGKAYRSLLLVSLYVAGLAPVTLLIAQDMHFGWVEIWREQTFRGTPHPFKFLVLIYGAVGIMGWYNALSSIYRRQLNIWIIWLVLASIMSYFFPLPNRREFAFFISLPLGVLAVPVTKNICAWFARTASNRVIVMAVSLSFLYLCVWNSTILYAQLLTSFNPEDTYTGYYITGEYREVFGRIGTGGVVLSSEWLGNLIPSYTDCRPYVGHLCETLYFSEKKRELEKFFTGKMPPEEMRGFLMRNSIRWVIYDVHEKGYRSEHLRELLGKPVHEGKELIVWQRGS